MRCVHIPVEFENLDAVRLFARKLQVQVARRNGDTKAVALLAPLYAFRLWLDWALSGEEWRPLQHVVRDVRAHNWQEEDLTFVVEKYCQWEGAAGDLLRSALDSGLISMEERDGLMGLVLAEFWKHNEHLAPGYKSIQQRGGMALAAKRQAAKDEESARQRREIFERNGMLSFGDNKPTEQEEEACFILVIRMDRACSRAMRSSVDHSKELMSSALEVIRRYTPDEVAAVERYLIASRDDKSVVKMTERILPKFGDYLNQAQQREENINERS